MIRPLVAKEVRDQRPFLALSLFFLAVEVVPILWLEPLGFSPYASTFTSRFDPYGDLSIMTCILAFALGSGLLVREQDDRTLEFLDGLPTSRWTLFWVKVLVALATVLVYPLAMTGWMVGQHVFSRTSLDMGLHLDVITVAVVLRVVQALMALALALVLAPLRRLSWAMLAVLVQGQSLLEDRLPWLTVINPLRLTAPRFEGDHWRWPVRALCIQLALTGVLLALALGLFLGWGERFTTFLQRRLQGTWAGTVVSLSIVGAGIALLGVLLTQGSTSSNKGDGDGDGLTFPTTAPAQAETRHYRFTYPASLGKRAGPLLEEADTTFETVRAFMGVDAGEPISADLGGSNRNTSGTAFWNTLRMNLARLSTTREALAVLGHETTHVLAKRLCGTDASSQLTGMRMLNEGLADYVESRFFRGPDSEEDLTYEWIAAAARARREVKTEELLDTTRLSSERDGNWVYPLGRAFIEVLVRRHGDRAPARVLAAIGRKDAPENLSGALAWQDAFQTAGIDLSQVFDDFFVYLDGLVVRHRSFIDALPRPRGVLERNEEDEQVGIRAIVDGTLPKGWRVVCRFRPEEKSGPFDFDGPHDATEIVWRSPSDISAGQLWYQVGLSGPHGLVLYEPWTVVRVE